MVLSSRERYIVIGTVVLVAGAVLYWAALAPLWDRLTAVRAEKNKLAAQLRDDKEKIAASRRLTKEWKQQFESGKKIDVKRDWAAADSQLLTDMDSWAKTADAGVKLIQLTPVRTSDKGRLQQVAWEITGAGTWRSLINLLWKIETARVPIRLGELQISARRDGIDDLTAVFKVSTLYSTKPGALGNSGPAATAASPGKSANQPTVESTAAPDPRAVPATAPAFAPTTEPATPPASAPAGETGAAEPAGAAGAGAASQPATQGDS
jgi:hypothetical protein